MMNNCERCCYFEFCTSKGRTETKDCVYGRKGDVAFQVEDLQEEKEGNNNGMS